MEHTESDCCKQDLSEKELENLDGCLEVSPDISDKEKATLYYISGYVCHKEKIQTESAPPIDIPESEFTELVSRGKLCHPPADLYNLSLYLYGYYNALEDKTCLKKVMIAFNLIYESCFLEFENPSSILRRYMNTFSKGFVKSETDKIQETKKKQVVKRRRIANN